MKGIAQNGNFAKIMFFLIAVFFASIITYQMYNNNTEHVDELITAMLVFFTLTGRTITEAYRNQVGIGKNESG